MKIFKKFPDTITIILCISLLFIVLTWLIPAGEFDKEIIDGKEVIIANSYKSIDSQPQGLGAFLTAPIKGFASASFVIAFVFLVGGAFSILNRTGAINAGLFSIIKISRNNPQYKNFIVPGITALFSLAGATFGMSEEILVFILITIPLSKALGYDAIVGAAIPIIGTGVGFAGAFTNPFTIGIAQGIAQVPIFSGMEYRLVVWFILTTIACIAISRYAKRIDKNPEKSLLYGTAAHQIQKENNHEIPDLTARRRIILLTLLGAIIILIYGVNKYSWYINEIAGLFIALGIIAAIIYRMKVSTTISAFVEGAKEMMTAALVIGLAKGLLVIAQDGKIIDTLLNSVAVLAEGTPKFVSAELMLLFQSSLNFFIPSGSGQAALTMPIIAPLSDLLGISRQVSVLTFQIGDGLTNMIVPTSGVTMGALSIAKIPFNVWLKWAFPIVLILCLTGMILILPPLFLFEW
ncbi:Na+/H+ antiporter NhaC family protein [uncultured Aquimarina sp.]|uniref:YfcC family protein n=1 Tax=uncultured Aquimarina sp. TaxID=575652 RepID=UPI0026179F4C|nr:Na+/H+ antiporter NhaC family protein [uncultured Aquimarina sp.]